MQMVFKSGTPPGESNFENHLLEYMLNIKANRLIYIAPYFYQKWMFSHIIVSVSVR